MIYIDRLTVEPPLILSSERVKREIERMNEFFSQTAKRKQSRYQFKDRYIQHKDTAIALAELFNGKCAYCESLLEKSQTIHTNRFRPKQFAMNLDGAVSKTHYWWLSYEWQNLYSSCSICDSSKSTRFPVEGKRLVAQQSSSKEEAILIDPCNEKDFEEIHFYPKEDGFMVELTKRGKITIDIFKLNRPNLIQARKEVVKEVQQMMEKAALLEDVGPAYEKIKKNLLKSTDLGTAHTSVAHYHIRKISRNKRNLKNSSVFRDLISEILNVDKETEQTWTKIIGLNDIQFPKYKHSPSYTINLNSEPEKEAYFTSSKKIRSIEINNFKIIKSLKLNFPKRKEDEEPWLVLLGENGAGKSSVLQAIALALAGEIAANDLGLDASSFVNRNTKSTSGNVKIILEGIDEPVELHFNKTSNHFTSNYKESKVILLGFGSTRLMANKRESKPTNSVRNLRNLFDPFTTLPNVEEWVSNPKLVGTVQFDQIAIELKKLLQLPEDKLIYRRKTNKGSHELFIKINKGKSGIKVRELSAGYQAIIAMALNIIKEVLTTWDNFSIAEGIVLIDEIGVHLHPKWKLQIISTLRTIFPAMNFVITTHEPLCLRGINEGEVALMKLDESNQVIALVDLPSPKGLTVEQLITSKFFGLITSFDPEVEAQLNLFYLLNSRLNPSEEEQDELLLIKQDLESMNVLDSSSNLEVSNDSGITISNTALDAGWIANPQHQDDLKQKIKEIWSKKSYR